MAISVSLRLSPWVSFERRCKKHWRFEGVTVQHWNDSATGTAKKSETEDVDISCMKHHVPIVLLTHTMEQSAFLLGKSTMAMFNSYVRLAKGILVIRSAHLTQGNRYGAGSNCDAFPPHTRGIRCCSLQRAAKARNLPWKGD